MGYHNLAVFLLSSLGETLSLLLAWRLYSTESLFCKRRTRIVMKYVIPFSTKAKVILAFTNDLKKISALNLFLRSVHSGD